MKKAVITAITGGLLCALLGACGPAVPARDIVDNNNIGGANDAADGRLPDNNNALPGVGTQGNNAGKYQDVVKPLAAKVKLGLEDAKRIALEHAGVGEEAVRFVKLALENDCGKPLYKLVFTKDDTAFMYKVDAACGEIVAFSQRARHDAHKEEAHRRT